MTTGLGAGSITFAVPRRPELIGFELYAQAFVPDPLVQNRAHALVGNTIFAIVGSR